jgi:glycosyltransferase involved in cell wall biosynthesis
LGRKKISILAISLNRGGAEKVISTILPFLQLNYTITLVLFYNSIEFEIPKNINVIFISSKTKLSFLEKIFFFPIAIFKYWKFIKKEEIDVSISFLTRPNFINAITKFFSNSHRVILSERCYPSIAYKSHKLRWYLYKILIPFLYNKADVLFSNSSHINEDLKNNFHLAIPMRVIYNPIKIPNSDYTFQKNTEEFKVINVGSFTNVKNQRMIIDGIKNLDFKVKLTLLGDGPNKEGLVKYAKTQDLNNFVFLPGKVNNVNDYLYNSHCFVLSSNTEGFPNALLEAMAVGLPVISTNCISGPLELLNENEAVVIAKKEFYIAKYGILINVNDSIALSNAITYLKKHISEREILGMKAKKRANQFTVVVFIEELEEIL